MEKLKNIEIHINNWDGLLKHFQGLRTSNWIFRGQSNSSWSISPTLERAILTFKERELFEEFKRNAHLYQSGNLKVETKIEWLSLMQHHGTPTRLLDWTKSPYVASFFSFNSTEIGKNKIAIWALDLSVIFKNLIDKHQNDSRFKPLLSSRYLRLNTLTNEDFKSIFLSEWNQDELANFPPIVLPISPFYTHSRLTTQQGLFLAQTRLTDNKGNNIRFQDALIESLNLSPHTKWIQKIVIPSKLKPTILNELNYMNINNATLFPGLDGFSKHLSNILMMEVDEIKVKNQNPTLNKS